MDTKEKQIIKKKKLLPNADLNKLLKLVERKHFVSITYALLK